jgi:Tfp pilus assembly protein PilO
MEMFVFGLIVGGVLVWGYNKYLSNPVTFEEALVKTEQEIKTTLDVNKDGKVNTDDVKAVVKRPRKKAGTTPQ